MASTHRFQSSDANVSQLTTQLHFEFADRDAPNRFLKAAMTERLCSWDYSDREASGIPGKAMYTLYKTWGEGSIGLLVTGNVMVDSTNVATAGDLIVPQGEPFHGRRFEAFTELSRVGKEHGSLMIGQLNHPGSQVDHRIQHSPVSASRREAERTLLGFTTQAAHAASEQEIAEIVDAFAHAAEYMDKAGFDGVELHAAHGYLIAQFLSADSNLREDRYGGSLTSRANLLVEIAMAIRKRTKPSFILGVKLNSMEFQRSGLELGEARIFCQLLARCQFDFVELSGGTLEHFVHKRESTRKREGFFMEFADMLGPMLDKTRVYVTGGFKTVGGMASAMQKADGVGLGRPIAQEPWLVKHMIAGTVRGAIEQRQDESDYGLTNMVAGSQLRRIGAGEAPLDMSRVENADLFAAAMEKWMKETSANTTSPVYGYPDLTMQ